MKKYKKAQDIKLGVIGYGGSFNMGKIHLEAAMAAGMTPAAVCDLDPARAKEAEKHFPGISTYTDPAKMLKEADVELVIIITPHNTHAKLALQCLKAGKHVICEKPLAITTKECDAMIAEAKKNKLMLSTYHNRHWDGCILEAMKAFKAGKIGDIVRLDIHMKGGFPGKTWRSSKSISGGIMYDWGVHLLEYGLQLLGKAEIQDVRGFMKPCSNPAKAPWKNDTIEEEGFALVSFNTGQCLTISISQIDHNHADGFMTIIGTKATYAMGFTDWKLISNKGEVTVTEAGRNPKNEWPKYYQNIADFLSKGKELVITPEWSRRPIHILDLAEQSSKKGKTLPAKYK